MKRLLVVPLMWALAAAACGETDSSNDACVAGDTKPADDGCNTCACDAGEWVCTEAICPDPSCPPPSVIDPPVEMGCSIREVWARAKGSTTCCPYPNSCAVPEDWSYRFESLVACQALTCVPGERRPTGDGCNECVCDNGSAPNLQGGYWRCSNEACGSSKAPTGEACGYFQGGCNEGEFCAFSPVDDCSSTDAPSICVPIPDSCTDEVATVCGCDGETYENRCKAAQAGTGIRTLAACPRPYDPNSPGDPICGGQSGGTCSDSEYCAFSAGLRCGDADATATCLPRPSQCIDADAPVCGCDGGEYENACRAAQNGTGVRRAGSCARR